MKRILLIGCGAEIGSLLLGMLRPERDGLVIGAVLTNSPATDPSHPRLSPLDGLCARIVLAQPQLLDEVSVEGGVLRVRGREVPVFFGDMRTYPLESLPGPFDVCLVATSKTHIGDRPLMERFLGVARYVLGVAEATALPGFYPPLIGAPERFLPVRSQPAGGERIFALGSCQTNGWLAQVRGLLDLAEDVGMTRFELRGLEVDIVHPDTPTGRLGTASIRAREQDPRDNLRPGFSQVETSMARLFPERHALSTISLRTLTLPPGYQICRFFFRYARAHGRRLDAEEIRAGLGRTVQRLPWLLRLAERPYGSRGFEQCEAAAVILPQEALLRFADDPFALHAEGVQPLSELILQAYVHNTRGYCRSVIEAMRHLVGNPAPRVYAALTSGEGGP
ncbi:hypothetical protein [Geoalkalibacter sp.]|uniref:hypothetical protein n=1 Tax=Geoalkalibacter sp. TaxID=3041440 RepID=UPI00272DD885|nr:hypothetical protein [Geoalkalibacter sp.]